MVYLNTVKQLFCVNIDQEKKSLFCVTMTKIRIKIISCD